MTSLTSSSSEKNTPLMEQYFSIKHQYLEEIVLFQVGDFYELFFDDAKKASAFLAIALTKRGKNKGEDIPLCGIPVHALNHYLTKLIKGGFSVVLCDQLSKPQPGTVVQRGVTQVFTPGTLSDALLMDEKSASYILSLYQSPEALCLVFSELLTAQLFATIIPGSQAKIFEGELIRFFPDEIIVPTQHKTSDITRICSSLGYRTTPFQLPANSSPAWLGQQLCSRTQTLLATQPLLTHGLQQLYHYLQRNHNKAIDHFKTVQFYEPDDFVLLDGATQNNLEIVRNSHDGTTKNTLVAVLDKAKTAMGSRTIKKWLLRPLVNQTRILQRQEVVFHISNNPPLASILERLLGALPDLERIVGRIALQRATLNDYSGLKTALTIIPPLQKILSTFPPFVLAQSIQEKLLPFDGLAALLASSLNDDAIQSWTIKPGFDHQLDTLRDLLDHGKDRLLALEQQEIASTGINSLKVCYNNISGYYIEITNTHQEKVPADYLHLQTLVNRKRYTTLGLKELEHNIYKAQNELESVEAEVFGRVKKEVDSHLHNLRHLAQAIAYLDGLFGFAVAAHYNHYVQPTFNAAGTIAIEKGRHPVVEEVLGHQFIPNDTHLDDNASLWIITGPNMGGKSTYLRQVALISLMAQCGSLVPAASANLCLLDRIFTRIGAGDNVAQGKSTFLVEMEETATICTQATEKSLVILDEVGRGTSTNDGIALAQAIVEYIATTIKARCLFATHYHELTHLESSLSNVRNYHAVSQLHNNTLLFLHKVVPGIAQGSFGVHVARLALLPEPIITRANELLSSFDQAGSHPAIRQAPVIHEQVSQNNEAFKQLIETIHSIDLNNATPRQAVNLLWDLQEKSSRIA
ncbi:MAG: DNA mismatch repair protein MutS [Candidatus Babeliales bacterium]